MKRSNKFFSTLISDHISIAFVVKEGLARNNDVEVLLGSRYHDRLSGDLLNTLAETVRGNMKYQWESI